jgi:hypothetical protein
VSSVLRSTNFLKTGVVTTAAVKDYVVPAGKVAVVTSVTFTKTLAGTAISIYAAIFAPGDATTTFVATGVFGAAANIESLSWSGRVVLQAGWTFRMARLSAAGQWAGSANGFLYTA